MYIIHTTCLGSKHKWSNLLKLSSFPTFGILKLRIVKNLSDSTPKLLQCNCYNTTVARAVLLEHEGLYIFEKGFNRKGFVWKFFKLLV